MASTGLPEGFAVNETAADEAPVFPILRECPFSLPATYQRLKQEKRVNQVRMADGRLAWLITKNEDARAVLLDQRFSSQKLLPGFPELAPGGLKKLTYFAPFLVNTDGEEHAKARRAVINEFSVRRIAAMKPRIQRAVDTVIDSVIAQPTRPVDLVKHLAFPIPSLVLQEFMGIPAAELDTIEYNTEQLLRVAKTKEEQDAAAEILHKHIDAIIAAKEDDLGDDLLSRQILKQREEKGKVDRFELASLVQLLQVAGHASSACMISLGTYTLLTNPDQLNVILEDPEKSSAAIEELLRYLSITDAGPLRLAVEDVEIGGAQIKAGDGVIIPTLPANRDEETFPDPDVFDVHRVPSTRHIAFGFGPHQCLGQNLVRAELQVTFDTLFRRLPGLRIDGDADAVEFRYHSLFFGPVELPVTW